MTAMTEEETARRLRGLEDVLFHGDRYTKEPYTVTTEDKMAVCMAAYYLERYQRQDEQVRRTGRGYAIVMGIVAAVVGIILALCGRAVVGIGLCLVAAVWWLEAIATGREKHGPAL